MVSISRLLVMISAASGTLCVADRRDLLAHVELDGVALADLRHDAEDDADVLAFDGVEGILGVPPVSVKLPVRNGTFWPTRMQATWLSRVVRLGVDRRFALFDWASAWIRMPYSSSVESPTDRPVGAIARAAGTRRSARMFLQREPAVRERGRGEAASVRGVAEARAARRAAPRCRRRSRRSPPRSAPADGAGRAGRPGRPRSSCTSARARITTALISVAAWMVMSSAARRLDRGRLEAQLGLAHRAPTSGRLEAGSRSPAPAPEPAGRPTRRRCWWPTACAPMTPRRTSVIETASAKRRR